MTITAERPAAGSRLSRARGILVRKPDVQMRSALRLWQRNATIYKRTYKFNILPNFFEPFFYLLAMGVGLGAYLSRIRGVDYLDFIAPGLVATAAMYGAEFEVTFNAFVKMHFGKIYDAIATTPLTPEDIAVGEILWATSRSLIYGTMFLAVASAFGVIHSWLTVFVPLAIVITGAMFAVIGLAYTLTVPIIDYFSYFWTMFITPMFLFSGIFYPLDRYPDWLQTVAWFVPLRQAVVLMRSLMLTGDAAAALAAAAWIVVVTGLLLVVPLNLMRWRLIK